MEKATLANNILLSYADERLRDDKFGKMTQVLKKNPSLLGENCILDISFNELTTKSAENILTWLEHEAVSFVYIDGNHDISRKHIKNLWEQFAFLKKNDARELSSTKSEHLRKLMKKLIFIPRYYIHAAVSKVQIYRIMKADKKIPEDWGEIHRNFYIIFKNISKKLHMDSSSDSD